MIIWNREMAISVNIETVWNLFALENIQRIMPQVVEHKVIEGKPGIVGTKYQQKYQEGKRIEAYIVEDLEHENTPTKKHNKIGFVLAKMFEVEASFTLIKVDEENTKFIYSGRNKGVNLLGKTLLKLGGTKNNEKVVSDFMNLVECEALKDKNKEC